ncbi:MAG: hypothetical protein O2979_00360 [Proteobacteria bacterium]|nr:hypothetical protein [Pseudomonadota bacterium]
MRGALFLVLLACLGLLAGPAAADRGHPRVRIGVMFGAPFFWHAPWYYGPPYYYYRDPAVAYRPEPQVYIEKDQVGQELDATQYWYFCPDSNTYYPYVKQCANPWHRVVPHPQQQ